MPVFRSAKGQAPKWCEVEYFEILRLTEKVYRRFEPMSPSEKIVIGRGECSITYADRTVIAKEGGTIGLGSENGDFKVEALSDAILVRMCGRWGEVTGGSGIFVVEMSGDPHNVGDPVDYQKSTNFDSHYHDCDEYWILFEGRGTAVSEGKLYDVGPGDCIATGMGHHHDFPKAYEPVRAVYFETTLEGQKRLGHLWEHTHGPARPKNDRV
jgi:mannose-6-phosphate isomerase-like protein (cupin superfamily)